MNRAYEKEVGNRITRQRRGVSDGLSWSRDANGMGTVKCGSENQTSSPLE